MNQAGNQSALFDYYGKPSFSQAFPLAMQHVVAAIVGCVTPAIIVSGAAGLDPTDKVFLIQAALVVAGLATLLQLFPIGNKNGLHIGAALPVIMGVSFAYVPSMQAIAGHESGLGVPMILGAQIVGGIVAIIVGFSIKKIRKLFPPLIAGTVVFTIGLSLYPTAVNYMAGGAGKPLASEIGKLGFGSWQNWTTALITLAVVTVLNHYTKGILKLASILIGVIVGYVVALGFGLVDFSGVASAGLFQFPTPLHFGVVFDPSSCVAIGLLFAINSIQAIGDFSATTTGSMDRMPEDKEYHSLFAYRTSNRHLQPERRNCSNHQGNQPHRSWNGSRHPAGCRPDSQVLSSLNHHSPVRTGRCYHHSICIHCHDRYQISHDRGHELPQYLHRRPFRCIRNGRYTGGQFPGSIP